ncbi:molybdopterin-dependent oxidoreductase [Marinovum sp. 2_MG-2023]|uniref:molybdopterin-dependent oxidoreductase n=1 Tax=unclassified Marinovum TaxID=2647166 RepID=UPI0026E4707A|nr:MULTISPECIES: molybdopterin-dependent oxidoreductase [unclassified Marinovum]MDO6730947.1 molybdopterin-dependent oxidoreductase [Marinovum sp. 2_MG-2023]MDO6780174.1 molybdopterin-dependent oxidoreductase [Marinovum sp. 1_MG-2023]
MRVFSQMIGVLLAVLATVAHADDEIVLTTTVDGMSRSFTIAQLQELPVLTVTTETIWTEGEQVFEGVPLSALLNELGVTEGVANVQAINDYAVDIPVEELGETAPIVAYYQNGDTMSRRTKGPLWLIYPYDDSADFQTELVYSRSIWQMDRLNIAK